MQNIRIPSHFTVIQNRECIVELKSQYHYWRLTQHNDFYILAHKYLETDSYHKQCMVLSHNLLFDISFVTTKLSKIC